MTQSDSEDRNNFLFPRSRYYGQFTPANLAFNANLQEFAQKVGYIVNLQTSGKITSEEAYKQVKALWKKLKSSKKELGIAEEPPRES